MFIYHVDIIVWLNIDYSMLIKYFLKSVSLSLLLSTANTVISDK